MCLVRFRQDPVRRTGYAELRAALRIEHNGRELGDHHLRFADCVPTEAAPATLEPDGRVSRDGRREPARPPQG